VSDAPDRTPGFWDVAVDCGLLSLDESARLSAESEQSGVPPGELVRRKSLLEPVELDIIETLLHPRDVVPGYELLRSLGCGGMGVVYEARQLRLDRSVALKTILIHRLGDATVATRFTKEARAIGRLQHPHIITAHDFGEHTGRLFLAMELVSGGDLEHVVRNHGPLSERTTWEFIRQAALALEYAHQSGIIHRDIKPANLLLDRRYDPHDPDRIPNVKIADFGLAFLQEEDTAKTRLTSENAAVGSPQYMAPEQLEGGDVDFRADIYALGATAWHLLLGEPPFSGKNLMQIVTAKIAGDLPNPRQLRPDISDTSLQLLQQMLSLQKENRHATYAQLIRQLQNLSFPSTGSSIPLSTTITPTLAHAHAAAGPSRTTDAVLGKTIVVDRSQPSPVRTRKRTPFLISSATILLFLVVGTLWFSGLISRGTNSAPPQPPRVNYDPGRMVQLYDGQSLNPAIWQISGGEWRATEDEEGGKVIAGKSGTIFINLAGKNIFGDTPFEDYRFSFLLQPRKVTPLKIHFAFGQIDDKPLSFILSLEKHHIDLIRAGATRKPQLTPIAPPEGLQWETFFDRYHEVHLAKMGTRWEVSIDGTLLVEIDSASQSSKPLIALEAGPDVSYFSDFELWELVPQSKLPPPTK